MINIIDTKGDLHTFISTFITFPLQTNWFVKEAYNYMDSTIIIIMPTAIEAI